MPIDSAKLDAFMARAVADMGASISSVLVMLGEKLGLYKAMAGAGPLAPAELARRTGTTERYIREWLLNQAAGGYVAYDPATQRFTLPDEQAAALADESSPAYVLGAFQIIRSMMNDEPKIREAFRTGRGVDWSEHDAGLFEGTERFFRPNYRGHLINEWLPALSGVVEKLRRGARVADVGCGHGASTILMAQAFPKSTFVGFDYHDRSIDCARRRAAEAGVADRVTFQTAKAADFPGPAYDLVACFDCLHDMGDPAGAAAHVRRMLAPDGVWMIVEPFAGDQPEQNLNPVGRIYYGASTMVCVPCSLAQPVGAALGAKAGEARLREAVLAGGFTRFRVAARTPFNLVLEARP